MSATGHPGLLPAGRWLASSSRGTRAGSLDSERDGEEFTAACVFRFCLLQGGDRQDRHFREPEEFLIGSFRGGGISRAVGLGRKSWEYDVGDCRFVTPVDRIELTSLVTDRITLSAVAAAPNAKT